MTVTEDEIKSAWADFNSASSKVKQSLVLKSGGAGAENTYATTYQALVRTGQVAQLRGKYR